MSFTIESAKQNYSPVILFEMDITQGQDFWTTYAAGTWFVNFDVNYPSIDALFLNGLEAVEVNLIGSVIASDTRLNSVSSVSDCQTIESSFYYNSGTNDLYVHCPNHNDPDLFNMRIGVVFGYSMGSQDPFYNNSIYEDRIKSIPSINKQKGSLFFGQVSFDGGEVTLANEDSEFDEFAEDNEIFGNVARLFLGFEGLEYSEFSKIFTGYVENIEISNTEMKVDIQDKRKNLQRAIPTAFYNQTDYPDLKDKNVNKPIPVCYGECDNISVICLNEEEDPAPANYDFLICDMQFHDAINAITEVRVEGVVKAVSASSLADATFSLAAADYTPGDKVTADIKGYEDPSGNLIENALDIMADLFLNYYNLSFNSNFFNTAHWDKANALDINLFINKQTKFIDIIVKICNSTRCIFLIEDDGRYSSRIFNSEGAVRYEINENEILDFFAIKYDMSKLISSVLIGYDKDWDEDEYLLLLDDSNESTVFNSFETYNQERFDTLLLNSSDAQTYADNILDIVAGVQKIITIKTTYKYIDAEIGDIVQVYIARPWAIHLNTAKGEIIGISKITDEGTLNLTIRVYDIVGDFFHQEGTLYETELFDTSLLGLTDEMEI